MKKLFGISFLFLFSICSFSQAINNSSAPLDTIVKLGGKRLIVDVIKVTKRDIDYKSPGESGLQTIERKQVQRIIYKSGRVEQFNKPVFELIEGYQWEAVLVTREKSDVDGLYNRGHIEALSSPSNTTKKAMKNATIRLQKKAANKKGFMVLVTFEEARGGYGEMPGYFMEGDVYGIEPLEEDNYAPR